MKIKASGGSHIGLVREVNQDRYLIKRFSEDSVLLAVADGLGGQSRSEVAAALALESLASFDSGYGDPLAELVREADRAIEARAGERADLSEIGTTLTAAVINAGSVQWTHVGDSRLYHLRQGRLDQVSKDQTMAQFLLDEGQIEESELRGHPLRNLLEQSVGGGDVEVASGRFGMEPGETVLLCSDGLYSEVTEKRIEALLSSPDKLKDQVDSLIREALSTGGRNNITVVAGRV